MDINLEKTGIPSITTPEFIEMIKKTSAEIIDLVACGGDSSIEMKTIIKFVPKNKIQTFLSVNRDYHFNFDQFAFNWTSLDIPMELTTGACIYHLSDQENLFGVFAM